VTAVQDAVVLALNNELLMVDQIPLVVLRTPLNSPTAARAIKASSREYSTRSCPSSSRKNALIRLGIFTKTAPSYIFGVMSEKLNGSRNL
jgi:hypothetical protein